MAAGRLSSYRFRRRLLWLGVWGGFVLAAVVVGAIFWNTASVKETFSDEPAQTFVHPKKITLTGRDKTAIGDLARAFVSTAVAREHPEEAYELVGPLLRGGLTREEWKSGTIPVVYYPVDGARWKVDYATEEEVGLSVVLYPKPGAALRPTVFNMAVEPTHTTKRGWLITKWSPRGGSPTTVAANSKTPEQALAEVFGAGERYSVKTSPMWLLLPVLLLGIALTIPVMLFARDRRNARRVRRAFGRRAGS
jgi:hypothetical protein